MTELVDMSRPCAAPSAHLSLAPNFSRPVLAAIFAHS
ncbi:MAG: hypothetical protein ACJAVT_000376 [Yoonia sp.]|jgi:hypothetical protein